jgi:predicted ATP-dependent protease
MILEQKITIKFAEFIKMTKDEEGLKPFDRSAMAALVKHAVRMTDRQEKIATSFPAITDLIRESDYWAGRENLAVVRETQVD